MEINEIEKNLALEADSIICCSKHMQQEIATLFGIEKNSVVIIPNGVEAEQFKTIPAEPAVKIPPQDPVVFFIGRLVPEKGVWQLISCFPRVLDKIPEARLVIGGQGPQKPILDKLVASLGISDRVIFTGFIREMERNYVYDRASVAVFPSIYEPFGIVALEAMATRTPVIVSDAGGLAEIIEDQVNGLKVPAGNERELARAIIRVLTEPELAQQMVDRAYDEVHTVYNWNQIALATMEVYRNTTLTAHRQKEVV
jgi:glycogen(starch) synthase